MAVLQIEKRAAVPKGEADRVGVKNRETKTGRPEGLPTRSAMKAP
jgi:hypothetical protein